MGTEKATVQLQELAVLKAVRTLSHNNLLLRLWDSFRR
jgi:hypothetical protein